ncbi:MAG: phycobilisome degradation protein nblA [Cyanobacteria bacterium P01_D01_bin.36]
MLDFNLSLEQQFRLAAVQKEIENASHESLQDLCYMLVMQNMVKENAIASLMKGVLPTPQL